MPSPRQAPPRPTTPGTALVVGASGTTGRRVVPPLLAAGLRVRAASRRATPVPGAEPVPFDWHRQDTHEPALAGVDRLYLVPPPGDPDPAAVMLPFLTRARAAGVARVALLSSSAIPADGPAVGVVHRALPGLFDEWAVLRPSWFMQNFTGEHAHARSARDEGALLTATGSGRVGFVDADDIAAVAAEALSATRAPNTDLVLTGPEALGYDDVAAILTEVTGRPVVHRRLTVEQLAARLAPQLGAEFGALLAGLDEAIAAGAEDRVTDTVQRLTGRPPRDFRTVAARELAAAG
ncbi:NAD(P)H-binding protein [Streptomyces sp. DSM 44915]|uniref:NAD(P)H-binding protein n=1 Tax=Streptomyces chisholmiae TaxID=3075540 RepID=A0ABU2K2I8_9ACTN|nr:NAD(P)H-binding protein [Streptomyces sp. DSM 44915]MDT0270758.1 NAD(P)H-binding protein [Streptomyces sp. DSM 44915]